MKKRILNLNHGQAFKYKDNLYVYNNKLMWIAKNCGSYKGPRLQPHNAVCMAHPFVDGKVDTRMTKRIWFNCNTIVNTNLI